MIIKLILLALLQLIVLLFGLGVPAPIVAVAHVIVFIVWAVIATKY